MKQSHSRVYMNCFGAFHHTVQLGRSRLPSSHGTAVAQILFFLISIQSKQPYCFNRWDGKFSLDLKKNCVIQVPNSGQWNELWISVKFSLWVSDVFHLSHVTIRSLPQQPQNIKIFSLKCVLMANTEWIHFINAVIKMYHFLIQLILWSLRHFFTQYIRFFSANEIKNRTVHSRNNKPDGINWNMTAAPQLRPRSLAFALEQKGRRRPAVQRSRLLSQQCKVRAQW